MILFVNYDTIIKNFTEFIIGTNLLYAKQESKNKVDVFVTQPHWHDGDWVFHDGLFQPNNSQKQIDIINFYLDKALELQSDIIVFPELSILESQLILIEEWVKTNNKIVIAGSQYYIDKNSKMNISPIYIGNECIKKEKKIAASSEKSVISEENLTLGKGFFKFKDTICGTLCVFICAEYLDETTRYNVLMEQDIDVIVIIALQKDSAEYFKRMDLTIDESRNGVYIIYSNNFIDCFSDGCSSVFSLTDKIFKQDTNYEYNNQTYKLNSISNNYFVATLDLDNKKNPIKKNVNVTPNVVVKYGFIDFNSSSINDDYISICNEYNPNVSFSSKITWEEKLYLVSFLLHQKIEHKILRLEYLNDNIQDELVYEETIYSVLKEILFDIKNIFDALVGDVAVHIKIEERILDINGTKSFLKTLFREPSRYEKRLASRDDGEKEKFEIINHLNIKILKNIKNKDSQIKVNSAYNEILLNSSKSWICNNLEEAEKQGFYFSSSNNWKSYYKSLAIFPIANRYKSTNLQSKFKGLLIIDSIESKCFQLNLIEQLGGYLAHRINYIFSLEKIYQKYFK